MARRELKEVEVVPLAKAMTAIFAVLGFLYGIAVTLRIALLVRILSGMPQFATAYGEIISQYVKFTLLAPVVFAIGGAIWGFVGGAVAGYIYNRYASRCGGIIVEMD